MMYMHNSEDTPTNILGKGGLPGNGEAPLRTHLNSALREQRRRV